MPKKYTLIIFHGKHEPSHLDRGCTLTVQEKLDDAIDTGPDDTEIDIWIDSPGGDAHAAYKMWLDLRARASKLRIVIPDVAKSAATLLTLGMDEIYMAPGADLGPLDVQITHPDREEVTVSALDVVGSLDYFSKFAIELTMTGGAAILRHTGLSRSEMLHEMLHFTAEFMQPCVSKIDPSLTRQAYYQLEVAERYAVEMLNNRNVPEDYVLREHQSRQLARTLVEAYPVHGFVISANEAVDFHLPVKPLASYTRHEQVRKLYRTFSKTLDTLITVIPDSSTKKPATSSARTRPKGQAKDLPKKKTGSSKKKAEKS